MAKPLPFCTARYFTWLCALMLFLPASIYAQIIYVSPSGNNASGNGSAGAPYQTIGYAVSAAAAGSTIHLQPGTYNELVTIDKSLTIEGTDTVQSIVTYTSSLSDYSTSGTVLPTLFKVTAQDIVIKNIKFVVYQNNVHSAIHTSGNASGLQILNNSIIASYNGVLFPCCTPSATALAYARRNAIAINPNIGLPATKYTKENSGLTNIKISGNYISGSTQAQNGVADANFRAAIHADNVKDLMVGGTTTEKNILQTINHDVVVRFLMDGNTVIRNNTFNGGGVEVSSPGALGSVRIDSNYFNYLPPVVPAFPLLRLWNGNFGHIAMIYGNTFNNSNWYIGLGNYNSVTIDSNLFIPVMRNAASINYYRHITINTKVLQTSSTTQVLNDALIVRNRFQAEATADGKAIAFYRHDVNGSLFGDYIIGKNGQENTFDAGFTRFVYVDNSSGQTTTGMTGAYPEYGSGIYSSVTAKWTQDIDASHNYYNIGTGAALKPDAMDTAKRITLNGMVFDQRDDNTIGYVHLYNVLLPYRERPVLVAANTQPGYTPQCYPNPVVQQVHVRVGAVGKKPLHIRMYTVCGQCIQMLSAFTNETVTVPVQSLAAGTYWVEMSTGGHAWMQKIIKQ